MHWMPSLTHLTLIHSNASAILRCLRDATATAVAPWPALRTLTIEFETVDDDAMSDFIPLRVNIDDEFTELICGTVAARELAGAPITLDSVWYIVSPCV
jgi:hypothetical protein